MDKLKELWSEKKKLIILIGGCVILALILLIVLIFILVQVFKKYDSHQLEKMMVDST